VPDTYVPVSYMGCLAIHRADYLHSCIDGKRICMSIIDDELSGLPYVNDQFKHLQDLSARFENPSNVSIVYLEDFFVNGRDFAFYVIGTTYITKFLAGMFGLQPYSGPLVATPIIFTDIDTLDHNLRRVSSIQKGGEVLRTGGTGERIKWRYLFVTARCAWNKLRVDSRKIVEARLYIVRRVQKGIIESAAWMREDQRPGSELPYDAQSGLSTGTVDNEAGMSEKKRGKLKDLGPYSDSRPLRENSDVEVAHTIDKQPLDLAVQICQSWAMFKKRHASVMDVKYHLGRIRDDYVGTLDAKRDELARNLIEVLLDSFETEVLSEKTSKEEGTDRVTELNDRENVVIEERNNHILQLENLLLPQQTNNQGGRRGVRGTDLADHTAAAASIEETKDLSTLTDAQRVVLVFFMESTNRRERESARFLARYFWNAQTAMEAYFDPEIFFEEDATSEDEDEDEDEDLTKAILMSTEGSPTRDDTPAIASREAAPSPPGIPKDAIRTKRSSWSRARSPVKSGSSGMKGMVKSEDSEEARELAAARKRLAILLGEEIGNEEEELMFNESNTEVMNLTVTSEDLISPASPPNASQRSASPPNANSPNPNFPGAGPLDALPPAANNLDETLDNGIRSYAERLKTLLGILKQGQKLKAEDTHLIDSPNTVLSKRSSESKTSPPKRPRLTLNLRPQSKLDGSVRPSTPVRKRPLIIEGGITQPFPPRHLPPRPTLRLRSHATGLSPQTPPRLTLGLRSHATNPPHHPGSSHNFSKFSEYLDKQGSATRALNESTFGSATVSKRREKAVAQDEGGDALAAFRKDMFKELGVEERRDSGIAEIYKGSGDDDVMEDWGRDDVDGEFEVEDGAVVGRAFEESEREGHEEGEVISGGSKEEDDMGGEYEEDDVKYDPGEDDGVKWDPISKQYIKYSPKEA
jgi:hypothetical protein